MQNDNMVEGKIVNVVQVKVTSDRQIDANRRNALKSTGAKTSEGKERSSMNALKHGALQKVFSSNLANQEDLNLYESINFDLTGSWEPQGMQEDYCVQMIALGYFKLYRLNRYEFEQFQVKIENLLPSGDVALAAYLERAKGTIEALRSFDEDPISAIECLSNWGNLVNGKKEKLLQKVAENFENPESNIYKNQEVFRYESFKLADQIEKDAEKKRDGHEKLRREAFVNAFPSEREISKFLKYGGPIEKSIFKNMKQLIILQNIRKNRSLEM
jgi:hypothetical protein